MKNFLALFILLFFSNQVTYGQCKYYQDYVDDMTQDTIVETFGLVAKDWGRGLVFTFSKSNSSKFIIIKYGVIGIHPMATEKGDKMLVKLGNDSLITLTTGDSTSAKFFNEAGVKETKLRCIYRVTKEQLIAINTYKIKKVRVYLRSSSFEMEATTKKRKVRALYKALGCFLKRI